MDSENQQRYQGTSGEYYTIHDWSQNGSKANGSNSVYDGKHALPNGSVPNPSCNTPEEILAHIHSGRLLMVNSRRRNGLILCKRFHAEFAGPGAAVGTFFDEDCESVIPVGTLSLLDPETHEERQKAYLIRRQWIRLTYQFTEQTVPLQRAQMILNQFETYFNQDTIARVPDEAFALLVGVFPRTIREARRPPGQLNVKVKS